MKKKSELTEIKNKFQVSSLKITAQKNVLRNLQKVVEYNSHIENDYIAEGSVEFKQYHQKAIRELEIAEKKVNSTDNCCTCDIVTPLKKIQLYCLRRVKSLKAEKKRLKSEIQEGYQMPISESTIKESYYVQLKDVYEGFYIKIISQHNALKNMADAIQRCEYAHELEREDKNKEAKSEYEAAYAISQQAIENIQINDNGYKTCHLANFIKDLKDFSASCIGQSIQNTQISQEDFIANQIKQALENVFFGGVPVKVIVIERKP